MGLATAQGTTAIPERPSVGRASSDEEQDRAVRAVAAARSTWARTTPAERVRLLDAVASGMVRNAASWVDAECAYKGRSAGGPGGAVEWFGGPYVVLRMTRLLRNTLARLAREELPAYGPVRSWPGGGTSVRVFPADRWDALVSPGYRSEAWLEPSIEAAALPEHTARAYRNGSDLPPVALVLGAGNVSGIQVVDVLHQLFVENAVVVLKCSPLQEHLGPLLEDVLGPVLALGACRIVYGGATVAQRLATAPAVQRVHLTGSDKTYDALVWGPGEEGERRKRAGTRRLDKPVTAELGSVTPVIVVPGPWSTKDIGYQGEHAVSMTVANAGHLCVATRLLVTAGRWPLRPAFLDAVRAALRAAPAQPAYYPGAPEAHRAYLERLPGVEQFGERQGRQLPYLFAPNLSGTAAEPALRWDPFCAAVAELPLDTADPARFLDEAVELCNERVWGSLSVTLLVHPRSLHDARTADAYRRAVQRLRYGNVGVNLASALPFNFMSTPWGAYQGQGPRDVESGTGFVHNTFLLDGVEKSVSRGPWRARPTPPWFPGFRHPDEVARRLARFEAAPSALAVPGLVAASLRG